MSKKTVLFILFFLALIHPVFVAFQLGQIIGESGASVGAQNELINFQVSIWISWVVLACISVYYKWTVKSNLFFYLTYGFILVAFAIHGYFTQSVINVYDLPSRFEDNYTHGVFVALQHIFISGLLTGFLHAGVWWFTRRWHRRY